MNWFFFLSKRNTDRFYFIHLFPSLAALIESMPCRLEHSSVHIVSAAGALRSESI